MTIESLLIDLRSASLLASDEDVRAWASGRRVFVSSLITDMPSERAAVREAIEAVGAAPVMFEEELGAQDVSAEQAYLSGVGSSVIYVGMWGPRYGVRMADGYSATHAEFLEAEREGLRLCLFVREGDGADGHQRDLIQGARNLYTTSTWSDPDDLRRRVTRRLRDLAAEELAPWVRVGRAVFRAREITNNGRTVTIDASIHSNAVHAELARLRDQRAGGIAFASPGHAQTAQVDALSTRTDSTVGHHEALTLTVQDNRGSRTFGTINGIPAALTPCSLLPDQPGEAFCAPDDDSSSRRAPEPNDISSRAGTAIQPFCLQQGSRVWHTEAHYACGYNDDDGVVRDQRSKINVGELDYRHEYEMRLNPRKLDDNTLRSNLIVDRVEGEATNALLTVTPQCVSGSCSFEPESQEQFIGGVGTNVLFEFKVTMDVPDTEPEGTQTAPVVRFDLNFGPGPDSEFVPGTTGTTETPQMRCDNYSYLTSFAGSGCVFAEVMPTLDFSTEKNVSEIAWHTQQAQASGLVGKNTPLHRATPDETTRTQRYACVTGRIPSQTEKQCDEYPYKSTREGAQLAPIPRTFNPPCGFKQATADSGPNGFSMCMVDESQNRSQGGTLNQFYGRYRVRIGDPFYVYASGIPSEPVPAAGWQN